MNVTRNGKDLCEIMETQKERQVKEKLRRQGRLDSFTARIISSCPRDPLKLKGEQWLMSEKNAFPCGVHASYTKYRKCIPALKSSLFNRNRNIFMLLFSDIPWRGMSVNFSILNVVPLGHHSIYAMENLSHPKTCLHVIQDIIVERNGQT